MNIHHICPLIASLAFLFFAIFVFLNNPRSIKNITYSLMCFCTFIWEFSIFSMRVIGPGTAAFFFSKTVYLGVIFIPITYLHFILAYLGISENRKVIIPLIFGYIISILFEISLFTTNGFVSGYYVYYWGPFPRVGPLHKYYLLFLLTVVIVSVMSAWRSIIANKYNFRIYNQNKYLLIGLLFYATASVDFIANYGVPVYPFGFIPIIISMLIMTYAIVKHNLLDINIVIRKGLIYSFLISVITIISAVAALLIENVFRGIVGYKSLPLTIFTITILVLLFQPLKNRIQSFIDKYFFHGSIDQIDEENIKLREELQKTEKLKAVAALAAGMAHEIKNPLTSIKTFTEYIPKKKNDPEFMDKFHNIVSTEVDRINYTVKQLLEFSKPSELKLQDSNVNGLLDETLSLLNNDFVRKNIKIERSYSTFPLIKIDPSQMKQVFLNLLLNAIESMENGGTITVSTGSSGSVVLITVEDTGKGIEKEDLKHIFDPFFSRKEGGTGLGLSVVHGIIEKHSGKINVKSFIGSRTSFEIILPAGHS